ncbi:transcription factor IBH1-like 1 [Bidens hawaiensis]|uniref:transcription factor IBH1-like 1 n=1 Tax=Bidens hawaiensis TaxID=980011 RepID=UPI00404A1E1C
MHNSSQLKNDFIKKWVQVLKIYCSSKKQMNLLERTKNITLFADIALASANSSTCWSKAIISKARKDEGNAILLDSLSKNESKFKSARKRIRSKKMLKKSCVIKKKKRACHGLNLATCIAKRLVKKRTQVLKRLVPGGESMDECTIIREAIDYILSLRVQVDVMKSLVNATINFNE